MTQDELKNRTKQFALRVIKMSAALPRTATGRIVGGQVVRSSCSSAANYRAACRARSKAEFVAKLGVVIEETDESAFWLEIIMESVLLSVKRIMPLHCEACELLAIFTKSSITAKANCS